MTEETELRELARQWWDVHREGGYLDRISMIDDAAVLAWMNAIDEQVDQAGSLLHTLPILIEELVREAPHQAEIPFIGTWVLENAEQSLGKVVLLAVESADLTARERVSVLSGYAPARHNASSGQSASGEGEQ